MMSLAEFERRAREEWAGRTYYFDSEYQTGSMKQNLTLRVRFSDVAVMFNPNCITFRNERGDSMLLSGVRTIDAKPVTASSTVLTVTQNGKDAVSVVVR